MTPQFSQSFRDNPVIYHVLIDRFCPPPHSEPVEPGMFHGGTLRGVTERLREGWFSQLGVNGLWLSAPFEQIRGWVPGARCEYRNEGYHGYWPLDFTVMDRRFGTPDELHELVAAAHGAGIKVILDIVIGHVGYPDLRTFHEFLPNAVRPGWQDATCADYHSYFNFPSEAWLNWWGPGWVRAELPGYPGDADKDEALFNLPQLRLDSDAAVALPPFLRKKKDTAAVDLPLRTVRQYLISWLSDWVRRFGIDGFRCDSAKHVALPVWSELKAACAEAYRQTGGDGRFWMVGEVYGAGIEHSPHFDHGFDSLINFAFQHEIKELFAFQESQSGYLRSLALFRLDKLYVRYAAALSDRAHDVLSYLSSHDTELFDRGRIADGALALMLAPGGVQIFYGDETGRPAGEAREADPAQATRSDMNWSSVNKILLRHWRRLGRFRARHVALARGEHVKVCESPYAFVRQHRPSGDCVLVVIGDDTSAQILVSEYFSDGQLLHDAYTGRTVMVEDGHVTLSVSGVALLELATTGKFCLPCM